MNDLGRTLLALADPPLAPPPPVDELERRWGRRRHRRAAGRAALAVAAALAVVAGGSMMIRTEDRVGVTATAPREPSTTVATRPSIQLTPAGPALGEPSRPATPQAAACRNSYDPACGPFRWDPGPVSSPLTVTVTAQPANPKPGQLVTFTAEVSGLNAFTTPVAPQAGDGGTPRLVSGAISCTNPGAASGGATSRYGPWDLPAENMRLPHLTAVLTYTYAAPGTYEARFRFETGSCLREYTNPYPGNGEGTVTVVVSP